jgi:hypothetical protein
MVGKKDKVRKTITLERHNAIIINLVAEHNEEVYQLKNRIVKLESEFKAVPARYLKKD